MLHEPLPALTSRFSPTLKGLLRVPGDKSISHRALILGAMALGETTVTGLLTGEDVMRTAHALVATGATVMPPDTPDGLWRITSGQRAHAAHEPLFMGNSGTSARLLMGVMAARPFATIMTGDPSLSRRPMGRVMTPLGRMGAVFEQLEGRETLPLKITGRRDLTAITYEMPVASAQVKSAILLAALNAAGTTAIIEKEPTRDHSERMMKAFGADITIENGVIKITGGRELTGQHVRVPGDPSSAAFAVVAALITQNSDILLPHVCINPTRIGLYATLVEMGANIVFENERLSSGEPVADIRVRSSKLSGVDVPAARAASMIDEYPILSIAASFADGKTCMTGLSELRVKESDRLSAIARGLASCGVRLETGEDSLTIFGTGSPPKGDTTIDPALDHRIAMSFLVMGMAAQNPVTVTDGETMNTSFPGFVDLMNKLGAKIIK